jgi:DUF4097 and DUF4098 domain-containing protein YvlB
MSVFETPGHVALRISLSGGEVDIDTAEGGRVDVELLPLRDNDVTREAIQDARVEMTERGGSYEVVVDVKRRSGFSIGRGAKVGIRIRCPEGSDASVRSDSADVEARGPLGDVDIKSASGDVSVESTGTLRTDSASGDVRAGDVAGSAEVRTASGDVILRRAGGPLSAHLVSGDLIVDDAAAGLLVQTVSGDVIARSVGGGDIRVQAVSGDVHLAVKPGERLYVDASSVSGTLSSELGLDDAPPADSATPVKELRVRTISGDLEIVRASAVVG